MATTDVAGGKRPAPVDTPTHGATAGHAPTHGGAPHKRHRLADQLGPTAAPVAEQQKGAEQQKATAPAAVQQEAVAGSDDSTSGNTHDDLHPSTHI
jgi:hypothetical protein